MSSSVNMFEARILIRSEKPIRYHPFKDVEEEYKKTIRTLHIERATQEQAENVARKFIKRFKGKCELLSCQKVNRWELAGNMENLPIQNERYVKSPYRSAIEMDEMRWKRKNRRKNAKKEKRMLDK